MKTIHLPEVAELSNYVDHGLPLAVPKSRLSFVIFVKFEVSVDDIFLRVLTWHTLQAQMRSHLILMCMTVFYVV